MRIKPIQKITLDIISLRFWLVVLIIYCCVSNTNVTAIQTTFKNLRYEENWSNSQPSRNTLSYPVKHIQLSGHPDYWLSIGGQTRVRFEKSNNFAFSNRNDDEFWLGRLRLHTDIHLSRYFRIFVEGKSAFATDRSLPGGRRAADVDEFDLQNAFVEFTVPLNGQNVHINVGRREMLFGKQRLISPANWANSRQTFDGVHIDYNSNFLSLDGFWTRPVSVNKFDLNKPDPQREFYGVYATVNIFSKESKADIYWLALERDITSFNGTTGKEDRYTIGARLYGNFINQQLSYDVEAAYQYGDIATNDVDAWMLTAEMFYAATLFEKNISVGVGLDIASGDDKSGGNVQTFDPLFPTGHAHLGYIDTVGRFNIIDLRPGLNWSFNDEFSLKLDLHNFWRENNNDAFYRPGGVVVFSAASGTSSYIGSEIDLLISYNINSHIEATAGYNHFFTGDFIDEANAASEDVDLVYLMLQYTF